MLFSDILDHVYAVEVNDSLNLFSLLCGLLVVWIMLNHALLMKAEYWESADENLQMIERVMRVNFL